MYQSVTTAVRKVVNEYDSDKLRAEKISKSRTQIKVNFPEVNPAFDTYRLGTLLEMVSGCGCVDVSGLMCVSVCECVCVCLTVCVCICV